MFQNCFFQMDPYYPRIAPILMKIRWPEAKFHGQSARDVQKSLAPQKLGKTCKKLIKMEKIGNAAIFFFFRAGSRCGDFFARGSARRVFREAESTCIPLSRRRIRFGWVGSVSFSVRSVSWRGAVLDRHENFLFYGASLLQ